MNVEELSLIGPAVDLHTVDSIHKKRLLAFVNHFVISTASFLNNLSQSCEQRFLALEAKMMKLEAAVIILESKLESVPGLTTDAPPPEIQPPVIPTAEVVAPQTAEVPKETESLVVEPDTPAAEELDPVLKKYTKMIQFGVPVAAVKLKMQQEGMDPALLDSALSR